jgi:hypothetical protein
MGRGTKPIEPIGGLNGYAQSASGVVRVTGQRLSNLARNDVNIYAAKSILRKPFSPRPEAFA